MKSIVLFTLLFAPIYTSSATVSPRSYISSETLNAKNEMYLTCSQRKDFGHSKGRLKSVKYYEVHEVMVNGTRETVTPDYQITQELKFSENCLPKSYEQSGAQNYITKFEWTDGSKQMTGKTFSGNSLTTISNIKFGPFGETDSESQFFGPNTANVTDQAEVPISRRSGKSNYYDNGLIRSKISYDENGNEYSRTDWSISGNPHDFAYTEVSKFYLKQKLSSLTKNKIINEQLVRKSTERVHNNTVELVEYTYFPGTSVVKQVKYSSGRTFEELAPLSHSDYYENGLIKSVKNWSNSVPTKGKVFNYTFNNIGDWVERKAESYKFQNNKWVVDRESPVEINIRDLSYY